MFVGGFDYLGQLLYWARHPDTWLRGYKSSRQDWAEVYGCTSEQLTELILGLGCRKKL